MLIPALELIGAVGVHPGARDVNFRLCAAFGLLLLFFFSSSVSTALDGVGGFSISSSQIPAL